MKTIQTVLIMFLMISWAISSPATSSQTTNRLRMRFTQHIDPTISPDGCVLLGIPVIDSLNTKYRCCDYVLVDDHSTLFGRDLVTFIYAENVINENVVSEYSTKCSGLYDFLCPGFQPTLSDPGDYLISNALNHPQDVLGKIYDDNDSKKNWGDYDTFNYKNRTPSGYISNWIFHSQWDDLDSFINWGADDVPDVEYGIMQEYNTLNQLYL